MKTAKRKHRKYLCNIKCFLIGWIISIGSILVHAQSTIEPTYTDNNIVTEIAYDYELTKSNDRGLQCYGTLYLSLNITADIERLILERTTPHDPEDSAPKFLLKREIPLDTLVALPDYPWRIRFRIQIRYKDGSIKFTDIYKINDFIDDYDLRLLYESSSTVILQDDDVELTVDNGSLNLKTSDEGVLDIFESSGRMIYSKKIKESESLDIRLINVSNASTLILRFQSAKKIINKKIHIR